MLGTGADGETFEGDLGRASARVGDRCRRGRVQHRACPATRRSSPTRRTRARSSRSPIRTSVTTACNGDDDESARPHCGGVIVRDAVAATFELAGDRRSRRASCSVTRSPGIAGIDTRRLTRHIRDGRCDPGAFGTGRPRLARSRPRSRRRHRRQRSRERGHHHGAVHRRARRREPLRRRVRLRHQARRSSTSSSTRACQVEVVPASASADAMPRPRARRRVPLERPRRSGRGHRRHRNRRATLLGTGPSSVSVSGTR